MRNKKTISIDMFVALFCGKYDYATIESLFGGIYRKPIVELMELGELSFSDKLWLISHSFTPSQKKRAMEGVLWRAWFYAQSAMQVAEGASLNAEKAKEDAEGALHAFEEVAATDNLLVAAAHELDSAAFAESVSGWTGDRACWNSYLGRRSTQLEDLLEVFQS